MRKVKNKTFILYGLSFVIVLLLLYIFMPSGILVEPNIAPIDYLSSKPYTVVFSNFTILVPSSTIFVYILGIQIIVIGYLFVKNDKALWGISLMFWGVGTLLAGTSYQGLGYELKCVGNQLCQFTSWFELSYLFTTVISIFIMALAFSKDFISEKKQKPLIIYATVALVIYTILLITGSILENRILISYEIFSIFFMPLFVVFFVINIKNYLRTKDELNKSFIKLWIFFLIVNVSYYVYYLPNITELLFESTGIWFSANDVLHVGLIGWFLYLHVNVKKKMLNAETGTMKLSIRPITSEDQDDFLSLFTDHNFSHDLSWRKCYCISYHTTYTAEEWHRLTNEDNILEAREKIVSGVIKGLLAFDGDKCVGWLNVNNSLSYIRILDNLEDQFKNGKTALAVCFIVKKEYRGKGIASSLLDAAILHCQNLGFEKLISLVQNDYSHVNNFSCPMNMYLNRGFEEYLDESGTLYVVKKLN